MSGVRRQTYSILVFAVVVLISSARGEPLPKTQPLTWDGDLAMRLVNQVDAFLLRQLNDSSQRRAAHWTRDRSSPEAYQRSIQPQRERLEHQLGMRDPRVTQTAPQILVPAPSASNTITNEIGRGNGFKIYAIEWPVVGTVLGQGLLLVPDGSIRADVVAVPHCETPPEQLSGLVHDAPPMSESARRLAEMGCRVVVPLLINRQRGQFDWGPVPPRQICHREMLYRSAFELGRGLIAYEVQQIQSIIDWFHNDSHDRPIGVIGWGEGGLLALYSGAVDTRIDAVCCSGYFDARNNIWREPLDRNVFGLLEQFGDAELASLIAPRRLIIEAAHGPEQTFDGRGGGAPARLVTPQLDRVRAEVDRAKTLVRPEDTDFIHLSISDGGQGPAITDPTLRSLMKSLDVTITTPPSTEPQVEPLRPLPAYATRHKQQMRRWDRHTQAVLGASADVRRQFMNGLDTSSLENYQRTVEPYRKIFYEDIIGRYDLPLQPPHPRTRQVLETETHIGYEVVLDVFDDVFAYGILLVPRDLADGQRRPVVVCQHGLEGRPQDVIGNQKREIYEGFAGELARQGYVTFAPQNLYIGRDRFRTLQRKSNPLKKTLFSIIVPQHQQIVNWLKTLSFVDTERIAFYGLSYGGKTAMRVPPLVTDYCLSICSADFNEWVDKNASTSNRRSYVWSGEYEIFEFDLGSTFNYAEMAALIAPRPFMVERGHFDGVADDWTVAHEFSKVRNLYAAQLKLPASHCQIEWFVGPHKINGQQTYRFLRDHLMSP